MYKPDPTKLFHSSMIAEVLLYKQLAAHTKRISEHHHRKDRPVIFKRNAQGNQKDKNSSIDEGRPQALGHASKPNRPQSAPSSSSERLLQKYKTSQLQSNPFHKIHIPRSRSCLSQRVQTPGSDKADINKDSNPTKDRYERLKMYYEAKYCEKQIEGQAPMEHINGYAPREWTNGPQRPKKGLLRRSFW